MEEFYKEGERQILGAGESREVKVEEPPRRERPDLRKMIIYSEIMKPKFDE